MGVIPARERDDRSSHGHRMLIGALGLALPFLLLLANMLRPTAGLENGMLRSISAYYHTGAVALFVGTLSALAVFLFTYRGYANASHLLDRGAAIVAGVAALLVAVFPTEAPVEDLAPSWWTPTNGVAHDVGAIVLFSAFAFFALVLFPKSSDRKRDQPADKRGRNVVYRVCGSAMVACMIWAVAARLTGRSIFWPEAIALIFFGVAWLTKGRIVRTAGAVVEKALEVGQDPGRVAGEISRALDVSKQTPGVYTLGQWRVDPSRQEAFVAAWQDLGDVFAALPRPPASKGVLVQSAADEALFYSFGPWYSLDDIGAMRADASAQAAIARVVALCAEATPGAFRVVAESG